MIRRYESPDDKSTAEVVVSAAFQILWLVMMVVSALREDVALTVFFAALILTDHLGDIRTEVRASRRLAERSLTRWTS